MWHGGGCFPPPLLKWTKTLKIGGLNILNSSHISCDQVPGEKNAKNPTEKFPGAQVWDLFSAKITKNGQFWPKIAQKSPGGPKI